MDIEVNDYIRFDRSITKENLNTVYGAGGAGIVMRVNKGKKKVHNHIEVLGNHKVARVFAGSKLGATTAIIDEGTFDVVGKQGKLVDIAPSTGVIHDNRDWGYL